MPAFDRRASGADGLITAMGKTQTHSADRTRRDGGDLVSLSRTHKAVQCQFLLGSASATIRVPTIGVSSDAGLR